MFSIFGLFSRPQRPDERRRARRHYDNTHAVIEVNGADHTGRILDVSLSGVRFLCLDKIQNGRTLVARVDRGDHWTHLALRVVWVAQKGNMWEYGAIPDPNQRGSALLLRTYVERFIRQLGQAAA